MLPTLLLISFFSLQFCQVKDFFRGTVGYSKTHYGILTRHVETHMCRNAVVHKIWGGGGWVGVCVVNVKINLVVLVLCQASSY